MLFKLQVLFFKFIMVFLLIGTKILNFRKPELFSGSGSSLQLCDHIAKTGVKKLLVVTDAVLMKLGLLNPMLARLKELGVTTVIFDGVEPNPTIAQIETGLALLKRENCTAILAVGGGSSIDAAKVIGARATNPHSVRWMGGLFRLIFWPKTLYAVPTTAGTGSEVTIAAVVSDPENTRKFAIMDPRLVPTAAALDPQLMIGLPPHITAATGMDALTHAVEAYISRNSFAATDVEALEATRLIMQNLEKVVKNGADLEGRANMALASFKAGVAFTSAGVGYVHAIAHNFGAYYHVPHGLANAIVMPYVLDYSKPECTARLARLAEVGGLKKGGESDEQLADSFIAKIRAMNAEFGIPTKVEKLKSSDIPAIATAALKEAHWTYAVPRYMDKPTCENLVGKMLAA
ncbi:iron-containing alcohol dehydrogenase [Solimonas sp. K1W22B-7]|uniref:iron-containing alcohol dehydrogenase n=1 Tax=Solimonas sp. K1W22B-7 TaxID=2303331 RepID=UPI000E3346AF|nr:iron-containing alcohol dehydrogenase [Solimonas sp. K1W22B-7]AXQ30852.1 iron-containing alcohol dehydrogenase [Solimonas sp. K1W22B-7]